MEHLHIINEHMNKLIIIVIGIVVIIGGIFYFTGGDNSLPSQVNIEPSVFEFAEKEFDFGVIKQSGGVVSHKFPFVYNGAESIDIIGTPGSCLCTSAFTDKESYQHGEAGVLTVEFNPNLHAEPKGRFFKTVTILTEPEFDNFPEVKIWQEIDLDLGEEFFELKGIDYEHNDENDEIEISNDSSVGKLKRLKRGEVRKFKLTAREVKAHLDEDMEYNYWTYDGTVPGTFLRAQEGDIIEITLSNDIDNRNKHSIDLHSVNGPGGGAIATQVYPGEEKTFSFKALNPGIYIYHCATDVVPEHVANGMYGLILVEPRSGLSNVDREYAIVQGEFYPVLDRGEKGVTQLSGEKMYAEDPEYIVFNGRVGALTGERSLKANVGDKVRLFVGNGGVGKVSSFHVIGEIFDTVYPEGGTPVEKDIQTTVVPAGGATIVEFVVDVPGTYKIVDHALARLTKGALAEIKVEGKENLKIFNIK
jgi:nitrite reductase (NO-forming)